MSVDNEIQDGMKALSVLVNRMLKQATTNWVGEKCTIRNVEARINDDYSWSYWDKTKNLKLDGFVVVSWVGHIPPKLLNLFVVKFRGKKNWDRFIANGITPLVGFDAGEVYSVLYAQSDIAMIARCLADAEKD